MFTGRPARDEGKSEKVKLKMLYCFFDVDGPGVRNRGGTGLFIEYSQVYFSESRMVIRYYWNLIFFLINN